MENRKYWQGVSSKSLAQRFEKHASHTHDCIVEQTKAYLNMFEHLCVVVH